MKAGRQLQAHISRWPYSVVSVLAAVSAFGAYTCMYAFRKAFTAGTFTGMQYFHVDYKVWLVIAQVLGYTLSKFYGIRFIAQVNNAKRGVYIITLVAVAWLALLGFGLVPAPFNIVFLFINGFPLGMIWGLVFGYLEGRKSTEFMAAVMSISLIFASGFIKTVGRTLLKSYEVNEFWMPFITGLIFALPLLVFVFLLQAIPPPTAEDKRLRVPRVSMNADDRRNFFIKFLPGIVLTLIIYVLLTIMRDVRDNFEVEIWAGLGINAASLYTNIDAIISIVVLVLVSLLILVHNNLKAFGLIHLMIIGGCVLAGLSTVAFSLHLISPIIWMSCAGLGLYMGYIPYNAIFFERMIASFNYKSNVGFIMYVADSMGYLGSISILLIKELGKPHLSWLHLFTQGIYMVSVIGGISAFCSFLYFNNKAHKMADQQFALA